MKKLKISRSHLFAYGISVILLVLITVRLVQYFGWKTKSSRIAELMQPRDLDIVFGDPSAKLGIYMYTSYSCTFCKQFFTDVYPNLKSEFLDSGKVKLIMRLTVNTINPDYMNSLKTAVCINKYGHYERLHELLLDDSRVVFTNEFKEIIDDFIQRDPFVAECILGKESESYLSQNLKDFKENEFKGTPTFVINSKVYRGYREYEQFKKIILSNFPN